MRPRGLLIIGIGAIAASLLLAVGGIGAGRMTGWSIGAPDGFMGRAFSGRSGDIGLDRAVKIAQGVAASYPSGDLAAISARETGMESLLLRRATWRRIRCASP